MTNIKFTVPALDCPDPVALAQFYADLTGLEVDPLGDFAPEDVEWIEVHDHGQRKIAFQKIPSYVAPTWPEGPVPQQLHLDFDVADLDAGETHALKVGATKAAYQPGTSFRVFLDPVGHPFCLCLRGSEGD
jgi:Glyoxalase-like domain